MGRDITPREHHAIDRRYGFSAKKTAFTDAETGEETVLYDPESEDARKWPNACFLACETVRELSDGQKDLFEEVLAEVVCADDEGRRPVAADPSKEELLETVCRWYDGRLDPDFYYSMENNRRLKQFLEGILP